MRLHIANYEPNRSGGGWTFQRNLTKHIHHWPYEEADIYFIAGSTMVQRDEVEKAKADGKKIVLRIDNAVRDSRNRNTGMSRLADFADWADLVIYQSKWAKDYLYPFTKKDGPIILNGVDTKLFKSVPKQKGTYLYSRFNRDETKGWEVARYWFSQVSLSASNGATKLYIVGNFSPELVDANFDFYMGEKYQFIPTMPHESYAGLINSMEYFVYTYFNDACSNSLLEARAAGCEIIDPHHFLETGGASEIMELKDLSLERMTKQYAETISSII